MDVYDFLAHLGLIGLSISTAIGLSFSKLINSFSNEIIMPLLGLILGINELPLLEINVLGEKLGVGIFLSNLLSYVILIGIIMFLGLYIFRGVVDKVRRLTNKIDKDTLEYIKENREINEKILRELKLLNENRYKLTI